ncbi:PQQ-binding-like beta-propeller repeat protein [Chenggangzhangella methanolivorans]|uniref:outer membrane protein assembly factor BamB family protein n=1 Tax=Chenggangzhangella methanolivorans TaxID=1437009 RepID=UPI0021BD3113|nr:PQQ-binding-like beta-propeller repeat protein [Chenggangzhangella methanolivorans]
MSNPEPENWLMAKGNYAGWSYTALDQITAKNVKKLRPVWSFSTGVTSGHEAPAIVNDGVMFVATPYNQVIAIKAATGEQIWRYKREFPEGFSAFHVTNRGVALWGDKVYVGGADCKLTALDAKTGKVAWESVVCDWQDGAYITSAPVAVNGKVIIGPSGGEFGVRGFLKAFDAQTGKEVWTTYGIPAPGEPGSETWPHEGQWKDAWKIGGATMWMPGNYDVKNGVLYWGVGNGSPWVGDQRPGDNLYVASTIAMDPDTGKIKSHFQYHWNDSWDWAAMNPPTLIDLEKNGVKQPNLISAQRNGYLYRLNHAADGGKINFVDARPFVKNNVFKSVDPKTGRPTYNEEAKPGTARSACTARASGAVRTGRTKRTTRRPGFSTSRSTTTTAWPTAARCRSAFRVSGTRAWSLRTSRSRSRKASSSSAAFRPSTPPARRKCGARPIPGRGTGGRS